MAFDDDHIALAVVVGKVRHGIETRFQLTLAPVDIDEYSRPLCGRSVTRVTTDCAEHEDTRWWLPTAGARRVSQ